MKTDKIFLGIITPLHEVYLVTNEGFICKETHAKDENSFTGNWEMQGIEHVKKNWFIPFKKWQRY